MFLSNKYMADPKAYKLEISAPGLRFVVRPVREFIVSVQQPRRSLNGLSSLSGRSHVDAYKTKISRIDGLPYFLNNGAPRARSTAKKKCMEADTNSCWSEFVPVSCK